MPDAERIFISWSGDQSKEIARRIQSTLRVASDIFLPFVSDVDIAGGTRGLSVIADELAQSRVAILVVNADNIDRPWLNFEAGSIAAKIDDPLKRVIPLLINMQPGDIPSGSPLRQFQAREGTYADLVRVFDELATALQLDPAVVRDRCDAKLRELAEYVSELAASGHAYEPSERSDKDMLEEISLEVRAMVRTLPEMIGEAIAAQSGAMAGQTNPTADAHSAQRLMTLMGRVLDVEFLVTKQRGRRIYEVAVTKVPAFALRGMGPTEFLTNLDQLLDEVSAQTGLSLVLDPRTLDEFISSRTLSRSELFGDRSG